MKSQIELNNHIVNINVEDITYDKFCGKIICAGFSRIVLENTLEVFNYLELMDIFPIEQFQAFSQKLDELAYEQYQIDNELNDSRLWDYYSHKQS